MKARCYYPSHRGFKNYGARGISVCERWRGSFMAFLEDMGECPPDLTLERINPDGHYEPTNCRWATWEDQARNRRSSAFLMVGERRVNITVYARERGVSIPGLRYRMSKTGEDAETAANNILRSPRHRSNKPA